MEGVFYCDPATFGTGCTSYDLMKINEIMAMPIDLIFKRGVCLMWIIRSLLPVGI
jgi:hypothetical protein